MLATNRTPLIPALILTLAIAACQGQAPETSDDEPRQAEQNEPAESGSGNGEGETTGGETMTQGSADRMNLEQAVDAALQDLAERSGLSVEAISVVAARQVTWSNGALGCPEEGMMYTQALVEGFYIRLSDGEKEYAYHAGRDGQPFYCPADRSKAPPESGDDDVLY